MRFSAATRLAPTLLTAAVVALLGLATPVPAQEENPLAPTLESETIKPQPVCPEPAPEAISFSAQVYEMLGPVLRARGAVTFQKGRLRMTATDLEYDIEKQQGKLHNVSFTTCTNVRPDYHLTAREATLLPNHKLRVNDVALYLGRARVLMLPWMKLRMGGGSATANIFPRLGYDQRDGPTLSQTFRITDTPRSRTHLDLTLTTRHSFQGALRSRYGVGGTLENRPGRYLTYGSMRARALRFPQPPVGDCDPQLLRPANVARLQPFGVFTIRQRTYDARSRSLVVYRQPELGVTYAGEQLSVTSKRLDPRIELYPQITLTGGRYKEVPGHDEYLSRYQVAAQAGFNAVWLGPSTTVQPVGAVTYSRYGDGQTFRTWGAGIDVAHVFLNSSIVAARYLSRTSSGSTPFIFDNIDIRQELDLHSMVYFGKNVAGLALTYDAGNGYLFDWAVVVGRRSDCLATYFRWDNRYRRFSMDFTLINM